MRAQHFFEPSELAHRVSHLAFDGAAERPLSCGQRPAWNREGVFILVDVHKLVVPEIDRVRLQNPRTAEKNRMLQGPSQRLPAAGRCALKNARIRLCDGAEVL